jgi:hypothetical protein
MTETPELAEGEMVEILKAIARNGPGAIARIQAIKLLREIAKAEKPLPVEEWAKVYEMTEARRSGRRPRLGDGELG